MTLERFSFVFGANILGKNVKNQDFFQALNLNRYWDNHQPFKAMEEQSC